MKPFSGNIIFWDSEFSSLDPYEGELLSIGMVKLNGEELYLELEHTGEVSEWVKENQLAMLAGPKTSREDTVKRIIEFVGSTKPYLVSYVIEFDAPYLYKLLGVNDANSNRALPFHWILLDFASMLFAIGIDPGGFNPKHPSSLLKEFDIDRTKYREHHALDDAKFLRDVYMKLIE